MLGKKYCFKKYYKEALIYRGSNALFNGMSVGTFAVYRFLIELKAVIVVCIEKHK